ncbi:MAG: hypothetical protein ACE5Q6_17575 [Dehalococcoidia bacterium]
MSDSLDILKDWAQIVAWLVASVGGVMAAFRAVVEMRRAREQRDEDLRWRQAREAKGLMDEMEGDSWASNAMQMLDWTGREYEIAEGKRAIIDTDTMRAALRTHPETFNDVEVYIRDCFDHFFDWLEQLEHFVAISLVRFEDLEDGVDYYVERLAWSPQVYQEFMRTYHYDKALRFLDRFPAWRSSLAVGGAPATP